MSNVVNVLQTLFQGEQGSPGPSGQKGPPGPLVRQQCCYISMCTSTLHFDVQ